MASLSEILDAIWHTPNRQMAWGRIPATQVVGARAPLPFAANDDYVVVRLASMFLKDSRVLWLKLSPLAHANVTMAGRVAPKTETAVIGPAQFGDLASAPADRSVVLNQRLAGPSVWRGGDLAVAAGLFAVPKDEAVGQLLDTLGQLSAIGIPGLSQGLQIAGIVKTGVEGLIGLKGTKPILGVTDALKDPTVAAAGTEAAPCILAGIGAPATDVDFKRLWIREGRLWSGASAQALTPYEQHDHLLLAIERGPARQDWRGLPTLLPHEDSFKRVLIATGIDRKSAEAQLNEAFVAFDADLAAQDDLTNSDKDRIRGEVIVELKRRLDQKYEGPFGQRETRSIGGILHNVSQEGFSFLDVGDAGPEGARPARAGQLPF